MHDAPWEKDASLSLLFFFFAAVKGNVARSVNSTGELYLNTAICVETLREAVSSLGTSSL